MSKVIIAILGCLGIGKTTFVKNLQKLIPHAIYVDEPVDKWINLKNKETGKDLLKTYYDDKPRWAYTFQNIAFITRLNLLIEALDRKDYNAVVMDGTLATDKNVYAQMLYDDGLMDSLEWEAYNIWEHFYESHVKTNKIYYVYLRCDPNIILERVKSRNRPQEQNVDITYLNKVQQKHDEWLHSKKESNVFTFDFSCEENSKEYNLILQQVAHLLTN